MIQGPDIKELGEEGLWELINDHRHRISLGVRPCMVIPYLRQARVLTELDEDEILSCHSLKNRSMRCSESLFTSFSGLMCCSRMDCTSRVNDAC